MIETTIGAILDGDIGTLGNVGPYCLYVIRDGETVFYVGRSKRDPITRVREHLGRGPFPTVDNVGDFVKANAPQSMAWTVELHKGNNTTEAELIRQLRPCLNVAGNQQASEIPLCYTVPGTKVIDGVRVEVNPHWQAMVNALGVT